MNICNCRPFTSSCLVASLPEKYNNVHLKKPVRVQPNKICKQLLNILIFKGKRKSLLYTCKLLVLYGSRRVKTILNRVCNCDCWYFQTCLSQDCLIGRQFWVRHYIYLLQLQISILVRVFLELTIAPLLICNLLYEAFFGRLRPRLAMQKGFLLDSLSGNASRTNPLPRLQNLSPATYIATMMAYCILPHTFKFDCVIFHMYMYFPSSEKKQRE